MAVLTTGTAVLSSCEKPNTHLEPFHEVDYDSVDFWGHPTDTTWTDQAGSFEM